MQRTIRDLTGKQWQVRYETWPDTRIIFTDDKGEIGTEYHGPWGESIPSDDELLQLLVHANPMHRVTNLRNFTPDQHRFFDELVAFIAAFHGVALSVQAQIRGTALPFTPNQALVTSGTSVTSIALAFFPAQVIAPLSADVWPTSLSAAEVDLLSAQLPEGRGPQLSALSRATVVLASALFSRSFEEMKGAAITRFGAARRGWSEAWRFGAMVRNTLAHSGQLRWENYFGESLRWRGAFYTEQDQGRELLFRDIASVELILLLEDMNGELGPISSEPVMPRTNSSPAITSLTG